jgi:hypothetical protein
MMLSLRHDQYSRTSQMGAAAGLSGGRPPAFLSMPYPETVMPGRGFIA